MASSLMSLPWSSFQSHVTSHKTRLSDTESNTSDHLETWTSSVRNSCSSSWFCWQPFLVWHLVRGLGILVCRLILNRKHFLLVSLLAHSSLTEDFVVATTQALEPQSRPDYTEVILVALPQWYVEIQMSSETGLSCTGVGLLPGSAGAQSPAKRSTPVLPASQ